MKAIDTRLARLEARRRAQALPAVPAYLVGRDLDDLAAQALALCAQGYTCQVRGHMTPHLPRPVRARVHGAIDGLSWPVPG